MDNRRKDLNVSPASLRKTTLPFFNSTEAKTSDGDADSEKEVHFILGNYVNLYWEAISPYTPTRHFPRASMTQDELLAAYTNQKSSPVFNTAQAAIEFARDDYYACKRPVYKITLKPGDHAFTETKEGLYVDLQHVAEIISAYIPMNNYNDEIILNHSFVEQELKKKGP